MKKSRYTETQTVKFLKEVDTGRLVKEVCREYGISDTTYYNWKAKYSGMEASDIKRLVYHSHIIQLQGESYRRKAAIKQEE